MKSPFVRFSRFVRSSLPIATLGLCLLSGCRQVSGSRHACDDRQEFVPAVANDEEIRTPPSYEEPSLAGPIGLNAADPPLVSLSEGDAFELVPSEKPEPVPQAPTVANPPMPPDVISEERISARKSPAQVPSTESESTTTQSTESRKPLREIPDVELDQPRSKRPNAPRKQLDDDFFEQPEASRKPDDSPEQRPAVEQDINSNAEPIVAVPPVPESRELAPVESEKSSVIRQPGRRQKLGREQAPVPVVDNEILSLDSYCNGLVFDSQGFGYVSHRDQIVRFSPTGDSNVWATLSSPKGHRIEPEGTHLVCDPERRAVFRLSFDGKVIGVAAKECDGAALRAPYDIAVDPTGGFYFTDPGYVQIKNPIGKLHHVDSSGKVSVVVAKIGYPTGIALDSDRQRLLVAESLSNRILEFRLSEPGKIDAHKVLVELPKTTTGELHLASLCLDAAGNLYVTQQQTNAVHVFDSQGRPIGRFSTGEVAPTSVALRGPNSAELFLTGELEGRTRSGKVVRLDLGE